MAHFGKSYGNIGRLSVSDKFPPIEPAEPNFCITGDSLFHGVDENDSINVNYLAKRFTELRHAEQRGEAEPASRIENGHPVNIQENTALFRKSSVSLEAYYESQNHILTAVPPAHPGQMKRCHCTLVPGNFADKAMMRKHGATAEDPDCANLEYIKFAIETMAAGGELDAGKADETSKKLGSLATDMFKKAAEYESNIELHSKKVIEMGKNTISGKRGMLALQPAPALATDMANERRGSAAAITTELLNLSSSTTPLTAPFPKGSTTLTPASDCPMKLFENTRAPHLRGLTSTARRAALKQAQKKGKRTPILADWPLALSSSSSSEDENFENKDDNLENERGRRRIYQILNTSDIERQMLTVLEIEEKERAKAEERNKGKAREHAKKGMSRRRWIPENGDWVEEADNE